jgi:putative glutamine amidotransferase
VQETGRHNDHREDPEKPLDEQYSPAHSISLVSGGYLSRLSGQSEIQVNSLHQQGIDRLGEGLVVEGTAPDGLIEAVRVEQAAGFAVAVQWHPEWKSTQNEFSTALFQAFGGAARGYARSKETAYVQTGAA